MMGSVDGQSSEELSSWDGPLRPFGAVWAEAYLSSLTMAPGSQGEVGQGGC